jgi:hypothetical protein
LLQDSLKLQQIERPRLSSRILAKVTFDIISLAIHPVWVPTVKTEFYGEDDIETCMSAIVDANESFIYKRGQDLPNRGHVRWNGQAMNYQLW